MANVTKVMQWGFGTPGDWTLTGDAEIAAGVLSLTAPAETLTFDGGGWSPEPDYDGNGDALLAQETFYVAQSGGEPLSVADGKLVLTQKVAATKSPFFYICGRANDDVPYGLRAQLRTTGGSVSSSGPEIFTHFKLLVNKQPGLLSIMNR